jgi:ribosomal protein S18 acetylase RimI-like enzyme
MAIKAPPACSLPGISGQLGNRVRTNCESLIGVRVPGGEDLSKGIAIGSGFYLDQHTHIEATRYPAGSDAMGLLATVLTGGEPGRKRILLWLRGLLGSLLRHPIRTTRILHPFGWARESIILLCMQTLDGHIDMRLGRPWFWPFRRVLRSHGQRIPTFIPQANQFARDTRDYAGSGSNGSGNALQSLKNSLVALFERPADGHYLIAEITGGEPVGALMLTFEWSDWRNGRFWWIQSVYVRPDYRRKGVYSALHQHVRNAARADSESCGLRLYVERENTGAQATYRAMGMVETHYRLYEEEFIRS